MAIIDCQITTNFFKEWNRMCDAQDNCEECPITLKGYEFCEYSCGMIEFPEAVEDIINIVQVWSNDHPVKTRLDDLKEKYPNAELDDGYPKFIPRVFGYCKECIKCKKYPAANKCWNEPAEGGATGL